LVQRQNVVVTRQAAYSAPGAEVAPSFGAALSHASLPPPVFCIGGGELFRIALPRASVVHATEIDAWVDGDVTFPPLDPARWQETARERHAKTGPDDYDYAFVTYERRGPGAA
jgi:dihydrofolate reductase